MLTVEISQLYAFNPTPSPPPADKIPPQPAAGLPSSHAASAPPSNEASRRFRYTPRESTGSLLARQDEGQSPTTTETAAQQNPRFARRNAEAASRLFPADDNPAPAPARKQAPAAGPETHSSGEKQTSTDVKKATGADTAAAMPAGVKSAISMPTDPLKSHREANLLAAVTPEQRRFHQSLRPSSPRVDACTSAPTRARRPVLQKRARENDIKPGPAASANRNVGATASMQVGPPARAKKNFYSEQDVQRDLQTLGVTQKLLHSAIALNAERLPVEQLDQMLDTARDIRSMIKTIEEANPASKREASRLRRDANTLSAKAKSHVIHIRNNFVRESPPRPAVRKPPRVKTAVMIAREASHAVWHQKFTAYRKQQRDMLELKKTIRHCFIEHPAMQYRTKRSKDNIVEVAFASTEVLLGFGGNEEFGKVQWVTKQSEPDAGYRSQKSRQTLPMEPPVHSAPPSPPEREQAAERYEQSNGPVFVAGNLPKMAFMPKPKPTIWRRLLKRIGSVLIPPSKGRPLLPIPESPNVSLLSYTRKP